MKNIKSHLKVALRDLAVLTLGIIIAIGSIAMVNADTVTITKKWGDNLTGVDAANRDAPKVVVTATMSRSEMLDLFYPVGTEYITTSGSFNPNEAWGGTWSLESEGSALISGSASGSYKVGSSYGANSISYTPAGTVGNHTLTLNEIPSHAHNLTASFGIRTLNDNYGPAGYGSNGISVSQKTGTNLSTLAHGNNAAKADVFNLNKNTTSQGGGGAHNHGFTGKAATLNVMQKSKAVYIWHRTA